MEHRKPLSLSGDGYSIDESVKSLLPECYIPSAYDFTSEDFIDRLKVFEMLKC